MAERTLSVCVFCGSRLGNSESFGAAADALGVGIADAGWTLVYGAGDVGLMGRVARATQDAGAATLGIIPTHLMSKEVAKRDVSRLIITENMHERKKVMFMNADAIVVLPGGAGSLDEFFEVLTWAQLGLHAKPIVLLNVDGFWNPLLDLLKHIVDQGFADASVTSMFFVEDTAENALDAVRKACQPS